MKKMSSQPKKNLFIGLILVASAFVCVIVIFYSLINTQMEKSGEISTLKKQVEDLGSEKDVVKRMVGSLEEKIGGSLDLERVLKEADRVYDDAEKNRKEGHLWIDRQSSTLVVTLGALNGLMPGSRLAIYDGTNKVGLVVVETPLDVISYVQPIDKPLSQFTDDYYRAVFEK